MLSQYKLMVSDFFNIPIGNARNWCLSFLIKKYVLHYENLGFYLRLGLKVKNNTSCIRIQSITMAKTFWI